MNLKKITIGAMLAGSGLLLHHLVPGILFGMKMDFLLIMFFFALFVAQSIKEVVAYSLLFGVISAMSTTFPGGQIANIIDKLVTGFGVFYCYHFLGKATGKASLSKLVTSFFGTLLSGSVFLATALFLSGVALSFISLILGVVLPAALINTFGSLLLDQALQRAGYYRFAKAS